MRILVTGAGGFVGRHLVKELESHGHEVVAFDAAFSSPVPGAAMSIIGDLRDGCSVGLAVESAKPDACVHLGGVSFVPAGKADPSNMLAVNIMGTANLLTAIRQNAPSCRVLTVSTGLVYKVGSGLLDENAVLEPPSIYAGSKAAADLMTLAYARQYGMHTMTARPNNHTGPGQRPPFAVPAFASQIKAIARGEMPAVLRVGNLESKRDLSDVRDVVRGYRLLVEKGRPAQAYNLSAGNLVAMKEVVAELCKLAGISPRLEEDKSLFRPADASPTLDTSKIRRDTGWKPQIAFIETLRDLLAES